MPGTAYDAKGLLLSAIEDPNPVIFFEHSNLYSQKSDVPEEEYFIPLGKADLKHEGDACTIVSWSYSLPHAMRAANDLEKEGINVDLVDIRTISPLDMDTILASVKKTHRLLIVHEAVKQGGFGSEIAARVAEEAIEYVDAPIMRIGAPFAPVPFTPPLVKAYYHDKHTIINKVKELIAY